MLSGTTGVLGASALEAGVDVMLEADAVAMHRKRADLSSLFQNRVAIDCAGYGLELASPPDAAQRGAHISYRHEHGYAIMQNLIARGVIGDFRAPDYMRFGFSPLFMRYADMQRAVDVLRDILTTRSYERAEYQARNAVT
jgi:kynureninase